MSRRYRGFDPRYVPTQPVEIGGDLPATTVYVPGISLHDLGGIFPPLIAKQYTTFGAGGYGPAMISSASSLTDQTGADAVTGAYLGNLSDAVTVFWAGDFIGPVSGVGSELFGIQYDANGDAPYHAFALAVNGSDEAQAICSTGGNYYDFTASTTISASYRDSYVATIQLGGSISLYRGGVLLGTTTGVPSGAFDTSATSTLRFGSYNPPGYSNARNAVGGFWPGLWTPGQIEQFAAEPFAMLRPIRRRRLYSLPSSGNILSLSARVPGFGAATSLAVSDALAGAATMHEFSAATSLAISDALAGAASVHEFSAATSFAVSDALAASASVHGFGAAYVMYVALAASLALNGGIASPISNMQFPLPTSFGNSIKINPTIRSVSPNTDSKSSFFSPRISGDNEPFAFDFADVLFPGETLFAPPVVSCLTGDLMLGAPSVADTTVVFNVSGSGTNGAFSRIDLHITTTNARDLNFSAYVLTAPLIAQLSNSYLGIIAVPPLLFSDRRTGDDDEYQIDLIEWLANNEIIISQNVSCTTGDLEISDAAIIGPIVQWSAFGAGTPNAISGVNITVITNLRGPVTFYCGVETR